MIKGAMRTGKVQMFLRISWRLTCQHFTEKKSHHGSRGHVHRSLNRYNQSENVRYLSVGRNISTCHLSMPDIPSLTNKLLLPWVTSLSLSFSLSLTHTHTHNYTLSFYLCLSPSHSHALILWITPPLSPHTHTHTYTHSWVAMMNNLTFRLSDSTERSQDLRISYHWCC